MPSAFEEIKMAEDTKINNLKDKHERDMAEMNQKLDKIMLIIQHVNNTATMIVDVITSLRCVTHYSINNSGSVDLIMLELQFRNIHD